MRFQDSNNLDKMRWSYVLQDPLDPISSPGLSTQDVFASLLEEELETGQTTIDTLAAWLYDRGFKAVVFAPVQNLLGKEKNGYVLQVMIDANSIDNFYLSRFYTAVYALYQDTDKKFHLAKVSPWALQYHNWIDIISVDDVNSDDKADIAIKSEGFPGGGDAGACFSHVDIYSWNDQAVGFVNLGDDIPIFYGYQDNCTNNWQFGKVDENGSQPLIVTSQFYFEKSGSQEVECPPYQLQTTYFWAGERFTKGEVNTLALNEDTDPSCKIAWAVNGNYQNDQALDILKSALEDPQNEQDIIDALGPNGIDYIRFLLAIWLDQRNEDAQADIFLQEIPEPDPTTTAMDLLQLAQIYREARNHKGKLTACLNVDQKLAQAALDIEGDKYLALLHALQGMLALKDILGLVPAVWAQSWSFSICDPVPTLEAELAKVNPMTTGEMSAWLVRNDIPPQRIQQSDLDGDGRQDWLVVIPALQNIDPVWSIYEIWGFLQQDSGLKPVFIGRDDLTPSTSMQWESITTPGLLQPQNILLVDNRLFILQINNPVNPATVESFLPRYQGFLYDVSAFSISSDNVNPEIQVTYDTQSCVGGCPDRETYRWNAISQRWTLSDSDPHPQVERIRKIEDQLFTQQNFLSAIDLINSWLDEGVSDPKDLGDSSTPPNEYTRSYLRYLLGLAYEQSGQPKKAVQVYYELWKDNPPNVFGYIASTRLERK